MIIAVIYQLLQLRKESLKKKKACTGFEPLTSAIPVQHSTNEPIQRQAPTCSQLIC